MDVQDGCELSLARLISDAFTIDSTPSDSVVQGKVFKSSNGNVFKRKRRDEDKENYAPDARTPSKFSAVRSHLSPYVVPTKAHKKPQPAPRTPVPELDFGEAAVPRRAPAEPAAGPSQTRTDDDYDFESLHDLEEEFELVAAVPGLSKYEIISTDSPDACSASGRVGTVIAREFDFGSPIDRFGEWERSENFGCPGLRTVRKMPARSETTRMLNFDSDVAASGFKFLPPNVLPPKTPKRNDVAKPRSPQCDAVEKSYDFFSLKTKGSPFGGKRPNEDERTDEAPIPRKKRIDSGIGGESLSPFASPLRHHDENPKRSLRRSDYVSSSSMESGFVSEMDEFTLDSEDTEMPASFQALISGEIKSGLDDTPTRTTDESRHRNDTGSGRPVFRRCLSLQTEENKIEHVRAALFQSPGRARKRSEIGNEEYDSSLKRRKSQALHSIMEAPVSQPVLQRSMSDNEASIKSALAFAYSDSNLIGDFSKPFCLPLENSQHQDLKAISGDTLALLMDGAFRDTVHRFEVIDCRYPYEFEGGHIVGAKNLFTEELVHRHLLSTFDATNAEASSGKRSVLVFHCEFSFERGPKLCRFLRRADRDLNKDSYPSLIHPELYLLYGGYRGFHAKHARHCSPVGYTSMSDPKHVLELRQHRSAAATRRALQ